MYAQAFLCEYFRLVLRIFFQERNYGKISIIRKRSDFNFEQSNKRTVLSNIPLLEMHGKLRFSPEAIEK